MRPEDRERATELRRGLETFQNEICRLPTLQHSGAKDTLVRQIIDSERRVEYVRKLQERDLSPARADPNDPEMFDPIRGAIVKKQNGNLDEAFWLVFYSVHFGEHSEGGWCYAREVYGRCGESGMWDWETISQNPMEFRPWLEQYEALIEEKCNPCGFGPHRKYQTLSAYSGNNASTGAAFETYVEWVRPPRTHEQLVRQAKQEANGNPFEAFDILYHSMDDVASFGRLAKFDYLTMVGKLNLADIKPGSTYLDGATGPLDGAILLLGDQSEDMSEDEIDEVLVALGNELGIGMQVVEDALCNWQKSPREYVRFQG